MSKYGSNPLPKTKIASLCNQAAEVLDTREDELKLLKIEKKAKNVAPFDFEWTRSDHNDVLKAYNMARHDKGQSCYCDQFKYDAEAINREKTNTEFD